VLLREKWPVLGRHKQAAVWLQIWTDLGRAPRTIDGYARGLAGYLLMCEREEWTRSPQTVPKSPSMYGS
jgi:integrase/recombinase XerD